MAVYIYGANDISFQTFQTWSNDVTEATNISLSTAFNDFHPANAAPFQVSEFAPNTRVFYGNITADTGGTVSLSAPYTVDATTSFTVKNLLIETYVPTIVATANYPYTFHSWRDAANGGGNSLSTSATYTLIYNQNVNVTTFYAYFTTSHIDPTDTNF